MNHVVYRVFYIFLVTVIYSTFTAEGAVVEHGVTCDDSGGDTCNTGMLCTNLACACDPSSHYTNNAGDGCLQRLAVDATCDNTHTATDQCLIANQECSVESGSTYKCQCTATYYSDSSACQTRIALTEACTATPTDQCILNAECTTLTCSCKTGFFVTKDGGCDAVVPALDGACDATDSATDQCAITDSECRVDGTAKCLCKATHYVDGSACTIRRKPDETCALNQCVEHATCDAVSNPTKCECDTGYTATPTTSPTMCSGVVKFASLSYMYVVPILVSMMSLLR